MNAFHPHLLARRERWAHAVVWGAVGVLVVAFFRVRIPEHSKFEVQSESNRLRPIPLPAPRGIITDRNGKILAENLPGYTVSLLPAPERTLRAALERLAPVVKLDAAGIERILARYRRTPYLPVTGLPNARFDIVSALQERPRRFLRRLSHPARPHRQP